MTSSEYLVAIASSSIDSTKMTSFEECYGIKLSDSLARIISFTDDSIFLGEERRVLSFNEIISINKECDNAFIAERIIPVIDCYDNDFIVYIADEDKWAIFNLSDKVIFKKRALLNELL